MTAAADRDHQVMLAGMSQGSLQSTERDLDVAIRGDGYFAITLPSGQPLWQKGTPQFIQRADCWFSFSSL